MKVEIKEFDDVVFGINLISENNIEMDIIQMFWKGGIKINGITNGSLLHLTFADLIKTKEKCTCENCECD